VTSYLHRQEISFIQCSLSPETRAAQSDAHYLLRHETFALSNGLGTFFFALFIPHDRQKDRRVHAQLPKDCVLCVLQAIDNVQHYTHTVKLVLHHNMLITLNNS
jgi:hypothetical protein